MGYTLSARFKSRESRNAMQGFLDTVDFSGLFAAEPQARPVSDPRGGEDLSYAPAPKSKMIGVDGTNMPLHAWMLVRWLAVQSDYRNREGNPVVFYDDEALPFLAGREAKAGEERLEKTDARGISEPPEPSFLWRKRDFPGMVKWMEALHEKWQAWNGAQPGAGHKP